MYIVCDDEWITPIKYDRDILEAKPKMDHNDSSERQIIKCELIELYYI